MKHINRASVWTAEGGFKRCASSLNRVTFGDPREKEQQRLPIDHIHRVGDLRDLSGKSLSHLPLHLVHLGPGEIAGCYVKLRDMFFSSSAGFY